jgi:serine O-acetyltransferase
MSPSDFNHIHENFAAELFSRRKLPSCRFPSKAEVLKFSTDLIALLFPHFSEVTYTFHNEIDAEFTLLKNRLIHLMTPACATEVDEIYYKANRFFANIPGIYHLMNLDAEAIYAGDPAAVEVDEVILTYPGFIAIAYYRIAHELYTQDIPHLPRILTEYAHQITGVDIHPGAKIGKSFFIDHGTGVVIGETSVIGDNVKIYQGVTLGAMSVVKKLARLKRHPSIEDNVVIYSGANILGGDTVIGKNSIIGGNAWLTRSVPPDSVVYHKSEIRMKNTKEKQDPINFVI